jgi:Family of unknown function (DUF5706)
MRFPHRLASPVSPARDAGSSAGPPARAAADTRRDAIRNYLTDLHANTREDLGRADSKAALLLAAIGVVIAALVGGITSSHWSPMSMGTGEQALWWAGVAAAAVSMVLISASVYPRINRRGTPAAGLPTFYGDVAAYPDIDAFRRDISNAPDVTERLIYQTYVLARVVRAKYVLLRRGLLSFLVAIMACTLAVVINALLS